MEDVRRQEVRELARLTAHLSCEQQTFFQAEYGRHRRNPTTALLLCILLGDFGAHYFYFGRHRGGIMRLLFCWTLLPWILALLDARTIASRARRYNASLANELLLAIKLAGDERREDVEAQERAPEAVTHQAMPATGAAPPDAEREPVAPLAAAAVPVAAALPAVLALDAAEAVHPAEGTASVDGAHPAESEQPEPLARVREAADAGDELHSAESHLIAAAWVGREPSLDDPSDPPLPLEALEPYAFAKAAPEAWDEIAPPMVEPSESNSAATDMAADGMLTPEPFEAAAAFQTEHTPVTDALNFSNAAGHAAVSAGWPHAPVAPIWSWPAAPADAIEMIPDETPAVTAAPPSEQERSGQEGDDEAEPLPWFVADATPRPAVSAAAAQAAAAWADSASEPGDTAAPDASAIPDPLVQVPAAAVEEPAWPPEEAALDTREPVLMYQIAAPPRRESVHMMPPPAPYQEEETVITAEPDASRGTSLRDDIGLAAVGSALAAGLAELLRERSTRPRSPVTTPFGPPAEPVAPAQLAPADAAAGQAFTRDDTPSAPIEQVAQPVVAQPSSAPDAGSAPWQRDWDPTDIWALDAPFASERAADRPAAALPVVVPAEWPAPEAVAPSEPDQQETIQAVQGSTVVSPAETYQSSRSHNLRRRVMQRVIVRKMAVLDGHVVAESTAERQVPVIPDEDEMSARVQAATTDAAREALQHLMEQSPEEVRPSIRMQLYALDAPASVRNVHAAGGSGSGDT